jgi:COP9 signalosome complex subunit 7
VSTIRELEDLIIEGTNNNVLRGKLDQKSSHFEVDYAMGRDIKKVQFQFIAEYCEHLKAGSI